MDNDMSALLQAATYQVADLVGPVTVLEGAGQHLLSRLTETDPHRWAVTAALGSIVAARKSLEEAAEALMDTRMLDGADMLAVEVDGGEIVEKPQCASRAVLPDDGSTDLPTRCRRDAGHLGNHDDHEFRWNDDEAYQPPVSFSISQADLVSPPPSVVDRIMAAQMDAYRANPGQF
ncbi:hypothetical protein [Rhodococcoides fascians]|uniref:hypothetical protein n=1 Tax=Rhodococcoides fascians TaxID=1828 RepID=UPI00050C97EB|nr:hypothetical protein [Rhodococcus fascians]